MTHFGNEEEEHARFAEGPPFSTRTLFTVDLHCLTHEVRIFTPELMAHPYILNMPEGE